MLSKDNDENITANLKDQALDKKKSQGNKFFLFLHQNMLSVLIRSASVRCF